MFSDSLEVTKIMQHLHAMNNPMWFCDFSHCTRPAVRILGDCVLCNRHLCSMHLQKPFHVCPTAEDGDLFYDETATTERHEIAQLVKKIDLEWLSSRASALRNDLPCRIEDPTKGGDTPMMGGMNLHLRILFDDGVVWLARVRRTNATSPPSQLQNYILGSEITTLKFLQTTSLPTPKVWDHELQMDGATGVSYIIMNFMPGDVLDWSSLDERGKKKVIAQLADIYIELQKHEFDRMGCLDQAGAPHVGPFARECLTDFKRPSREMQPLGPFLHLQDYYEACINLLLDLILRGEIYTDRPVDVFLMYRFLIDRVPEIYPVNPETAASKGKFYLKHADDKGFHILVDAESNITGLIDWEWAYIAPASLAFNSPMLLLPTSEFFNGATEIGEDEEAFAEILEAKGRSDMAKCVREGRVHHQVAFLCTLDLCLPFEDLLGLFKGLKKNLNVDEEYGWEEWRKVAIERYADDERLRDLLERSGGKNI